MFLLSCGGGSSGDEEVRDGREDGGGVEQGLIVAGGRDPLRQGVRHVAALLILIVNDGDHYRQGQCQCPPRCHGYMAYYYDSRDNDDNNGSTTPPTALSASAVGEGGGRGAARTNAIIEAGMRKIVRRRIISMTMNDDDGINVVTPMQKTRQQQGLPTGNIARGAIHECKNDDVTMYDWVNVEVNLEEPISSGYPAQPRLTWRNPSGWPAQPG